MHRLALRKFGGSTCFVPVSGANLLFAKKLDMQGVDVRFVYQPPAEVPANWPEGNWCSSLETWVEQRLARAAGTSDLLSNPRVASERLSAALQRDLSDASIRASSVSARIELPAGWERTRPVPEIAQLARGANPVIFVGLDGGDWQLLDEYMAHGSMPNLTRLVQEGASVEVTTEHPPLSPIIWTTMMTGVSPVEH